MIQQGFVTACNNKRGWRWQSSEQTYNGLQLAYMMYVWQKEMKTAYATPGGGALGQVLFADMKIGTGLRAARYGAGIAWSVLVNPQFRACLADYGGKPFPSCLTHIAFRNLKVHTWGFLKPTVSTIVDNCAVFLDPGVSDVIKAGVSFTPEHESAALAKVLPNVDTYLQSFRDAYAYRQAGDNSLGGE